jgi:transposase
MMQTMKPYSEDLRRRIVRAVRGGIPKSSAACVFGVSLSSVKRYFRIAKQGASLAPREGGGRPPKTNETVEKLLEDDVEKRPEATLSERRRFLECTTGTVLSDSTVKRQLKRLGFSRKKRTVGAMERDEWLRATWRRTIAREITLERLVFVDEMGTNASLHPLYAWSPRGERGRCSVARNRGPNTTLLASMTAEGMGPCLAMEGAKRSSRKLSRHKEGRGL